MAGFDDLKMLETPEAGEQSQPISAKGFDALEVQFQQQQGTKRNFFGDIWGGFKSGIYSSLGGVGKFIDMMAPNDELEIIQGLEGAPSKEEIENLPEVDKKYEVDPDVLLKKAVEAWPKDLDMDIIGDLFSKNFEDAIYKTIVGGISSMPQLLVMIGSSAVGKPEVGLSILGASTTGQTYSELEEQEDISESKKRAISLAHGVIEAGVEYFTVNQSLNHIFRGADKQALVSGVKKAMIHILETEMAEEAITSLATDFVDRITGVSPDMTSGQMWRRAGNSFLLALLPGLGLKAVELKAASRGTEVAQDYGYANPETKGKQIDSYSKTVIDYSLKEDLDPSILISMMKVESDFTDTGNKKSSAKGPLQVTNVVFKDLENNGITLENSPDTVEGKLEAGVKYFKLLKDNYKLQGNELIAAYFAGPTYIRNNGITNEVLDGHQSPAGYVKDVQEAHKVLMRVDDEVVHVEDREQIQQQQLQLKEEEIVIDNTDAIEPIQEALVSKGYLLEATGSWDADTLSALTRFQLDNDIWDTSSLISGEPSQEVLEALEVQIDEDTRPKVELRVDNPRQYNSYWDMYENWTKDQMSKYYKKNVKGEVDNLIGQHKNKNIVDWIMNGEEERAAVEGTNLSLIGTPKSTRASINTKRILADTDIQQSLEMLGQILDKDTTVDRTTHEEIRKKMREKFGDSDKDDLLTSIEKYGLTKKKTQALRDALDEAPELVLAHRELVTANQKGILELRNKIKKGVGSDVDKVKLIQMLLENTDLLADLKDVSRRVAQTLNQFNIEVSGNMINIADLDIEHIRYMVDEGAELKGIIKAFGEKNLNKVINNIDKNSTPGDINKVARDSGATRAIKAIVEYRTSNLLRSLLTGVKNMTSQTANVAYENIVDYVDASIGLLKRNNVDTSSVEGVQQTMPMTFKKAFLSQTRGIQSMFQSFFKPIVTLKDGASVMFGKQMSRWDIIKLAATDTGKFEELFNDVMLSTRIGVEQKGLNYKRISSEYLFPDLDTSKPIGDWLSKVVDKAGAISRLMGYGVVQVTDLPYMYEGYYKGLTEYVADVAMTDDVRTMKRKDRRTYLKQIEKGAEALRKQQIYKQITKGTKEIPELSILKELNKKQLQLAKKADEFAKARSDRMTWKEDFDPDIVPWNGLKTIENSLSAIPAARVLIPFFHTGSKILEKGIDSNLLTKKGIQEIRGKHGKRLQTRRLARTALTGVLWGTFGLMVVNGFITPPARTSDEERRMRENGKPPNSIRIEDTWYDYSQLLPFPGLLLSTVSNVVRSIYEAQISEERDASDAIYDIAQRGWQAVYRSTMDATFMASVERLISAMEGTTTKNYVKDFFQSFLPNYTFQNNYKRINWFGANPLYEDYLVTDEGYVRRDRFGKPISNYKYVFGTRTSDFKPSPIRGELEKLDLTLPKLSDVWMSTRMTDEQYQELLRYFDEEIHAEERMNEVVNTTQYKLATDSQKQRIIRKAWEGLKDKARGATLASTERSFIEQLLQDRQVEQQRQQKTKGGYLRRFVAGEYLEGFSLKEAFKKITNIGNSGGD